MATETQESALRLAGGRWSRRPPGRQPSFRPVQFYREVVTSSAR